MGYNHEHDTDTNDDDTLRFSALAMAIEAKCGQSYDDTGNVIFNDDKFVTAAAKFYLFLKEFTKETAK